MSGEFERIASLRRLTAGRGRGVVLGVGDDGALLEPRPGFDTVISSDLLVEGVHFRRFWMTPEQLGFKAIAVSLSDLAAMGAAPSAILLGLGLPADVDDAFLEAFYRGATALAGRFEATIVGGDLSSSPGGLFVDSVLVGHVEQGRALRRDRARDGQDVYVSGVLGTSAAGLRLLESQDVRESRPGCYDSFVRAHLAPEPRVELGRELVLRGLASAAIDLSDGLSSDARHVATASSVGIVIDGDAVPAPAGLEPALHGGEQYELLFTADVGRRDALETLSVEIGLPLARIGRADRSVTGCWIEVEGRRDPLDPAGFDHFGSMRRRPDEF
ncbi:MAG: thiamine-phosphate kinase [Acidobacteria bacterium]|nr:thiamine-phosphate kinase [Acidobacteriota bacterium]